MVFGKCKPRVNVIVVWQKGLFLCQARLKTHFQSRVWGQQKCKVQPKPEGTYEEQTDKITDLLVTKYMVNR